MTHVCVVLDLFMNTQSFMFFLLAGKWGGTQELACEESLTDSFDRVETFLADPKVWNIVVLQWVLQCVLQCLVDCVAVSLRYGRSLCCSGCCSVLQCVAVCCSVS